MCDPQASSADDAGEAPEYEAHRYDSGFRYRLSHYRTWDPPGQKASEPGR